MEAISSFFVKSTLFFAHSPLTANFSGPFEGACACSRRELFLRHGGRNAGD